MIDDLHSDPTYILASSYIVLRDDTTRLPADSQSNANTLPDVSSEQFYIISDEPPTHLDTWRCHSRVSERSGDSPRGFGWRGTIQVMAKWYCESAHKHGDYTAEACITTVTIAMENTLDVGRLLLSCKGDTLKKTFLGEMLFGNLTSSLCWYWKGNWFDCVEQGSQIGLITTGSMALSPLLCTTADSGLLDACNAVGGIFVQVLRVEGIPGVIMRAYSSEAAYAIDETLERLCSQGRHVRMCEAEIESQCELVSESVRAIYEEWSTM